MCADYATFICPLGCDQKVNSGLTGLQNHIDSICSLRLITCPNLCMKPDDIDYLMESRALKEHYKKCSYVHCEKCKAKM